MEKRFFAFMLKYGLPEYEGNQYMSDQCVITGNSMDDLFQNFCLANNYKTDDCNWTHTFEGGISYWGMPICFIEVEDDFKLEERNTKNEYIPRYSDLFLTSQFLVPFPKKINKNISNDRKYPQSKFWDCAYSVEQIFDKSPTCIMNTKFKPHKSDDSYAFICLYFPTSSIVGEDSYLSGKDNTAFEIGICEDGFVYNGTTTFPHDTELDSSLYIMKTEKAIELMLELRNLMIARDIFASKLVTARTDVGGTLKEDCVNIILSNGYTLEKEYQQK